MYDLHAAGLTGFQEPNHVHIHERYFLQVQDKLWTVFLNLPLQFINVLQLKVTDQADRCCSTVRLLFDLQCPLCLIEASICRGFATSLPNAIY